MKTIILIFTFSFLVKNTEAQSPGFSYTNGATNTVPGHPEQPAEQFNGVNYGQSTEINTNTVIAPNSSFITTPNNINQQPVNTNLNTPNQSNTTNTLQSAPATNTPKNNFNHLVFFQDPVKTPKHPNQSTKVGTVDGSSGKFKNPHVDHHKKNSFAHNSHHLKTAKHNKEHSTKGYETTSSK
ncbi:MAG: hypothetical protein ABIP51_14510 [Bacteroidia bacterium]